MVKEKGDWAVSEVGYSAKSRRRMVEMRMASQPSPQMRSIKMGKDSLTIALATNNVHNSKYDFLRTGKIFEAYRRCSGEPDFCKTNKFVSSRAIKPSVRP